uniref:Pyridoxal kinase n=1 Tax=Panagrolaimus superbus TaxID=310955 RepID=A0A914YTX9_9BILA
MKTVEERLKCERSNKRVLSIQSHVVSGYAGNKCSVFPLQLHGFEVDFINSVQFSQHTGHKVVRGQRLTKDDLDILYQGLKENGINKYSHILTGYCGDPSFLNRIAKIVSDLKALYKEDLLYVCDPVLGDGGEYYAPKELMPIYRDTILPLADIITPNIFELSELSGIQISNERECLNAISKIHSKCPNLSIIVVTSGLISTDNSQMYCYASKNLKNGNFEQCRFTIPLIRGQFVGTGDIFASLLIVWLDELKGNIKPAVNNVIASLQALLKRTSEAAFRFGAEKPTAFERELKMIESRFDLLVPNLEIESIDI